MIAFDILYLIAASVVLLSVAAGIAYAVYEMLTGTAGLPEYDDVEVDR